MLCDRLVDSDAKFPLTPALSQWEREISAAVLAEGDRFMVGIGIPSSRVRPTPGNLGIQNSLMPARYDNR
jgi:hypothetical protein